MKKLNLVIADSDELYVRGVSRYLTNNHLSEFQIISITDGNYLEEYLNNDEVLDILVIGEEFYKKIKSRRFIDTIITLKEDKENNNVMSIFKFQAGNKIYLEIKKIYADNNPEYEVSSKNSISTSINTVYSPIGGIGKTIISISMLLKLAYKYKEVLYLNLEDIASTDIFFSCDEEKPLSDLLYLARERNENLRSSILNYLQRDRNGIYYFSPINSILDYETINSEDLIFFINTLKELNKFHYIIIDLSSKFSTKYSTIMNLSNNIITILGDDKLSCLKVNNFLKQQETLAKIHFVLNKHRSEELNNVPFEITTEKKTILHKIEYYDFLQNKINSIEDIQGHNGFELSIGELNEKLFN